MVTISGGHFPEFRAVALPLEQAGWVAWILFVNIQGVS